MKTSFFPQCHWINKLSGNLRTCKRPRPMTARLQFTRCVPVGRSVGVRDLTILLLTLNHAAQGRSVVCWNFRILLCDYTHNHWSAVLLHLNDRRCITILLLLLLLLLVVYYYHYYYYFYYFISPSQETKFTQITLMTAHRHCHTFQQSQIQHSSHLLHGQPWHGLPAPSPHCPSYAISCDVMSCAVMWCDVSVYGGGGDIPSPQRGLINLYCIVLYCIVLYCIVLYWLSHWIVLLHEKRRSVYSDWHSRLPERPGLVHAHDARVLLRKAIARPGKWLILPYRPSLLICQASASCLPGWIMQ